MRELTAQPVPAAGGTGVAMHSAPQDSKTPTRHSIVVKALCSLPWTEYGWDPAASYTCSVARK